MQHLQQFMARIAKLRQDSSLKEQEWKRLTEEVVAIARPQAVVAAAVPVTPGDPGDITVQWYAEGDYVGDAAIDLSGEPTSFDRGTLSKKTIQVPVLHKEFEALWREGLSSAKQGRNLLTDEGRRASLKVVDSLEKFLLNGGQEFKGLTNAAGIQTQSGSDWGTAGRAYTQSKDAVGKLWAKNIFSPPVLILHPDQYAETFEVFGSTGIPQIEKMRGFFGDRIFTTPNLATGTGLVFARDPGWVDRYVGLDLRVDPLPMLARNERAQVLTAQVLRVKNADAVVKLTSI